MYCMYCESKSVSQKRLENQTLVIETVSCGFRHNIIPQWFNPRRSIYNIILLDLVSDGNQRTQ